MTPEGRVKADIDAILDSIHIYYFKPTTFGLGKSGNPDYICCAGGLFVTIEAKAEGEVPRLLQVYTMQQIREAGGVTLVVNPNNIHMLEPTLLGILGTMNKLSIYKKFEMFVRTKMQALASIVGFTKTYGETK